MKKQFSKLTKLEQEKVELEYHRMKPEEFDELMSRAKSHTPDAVLIPRKMAKTLKTIAKLEGESRYQTMVRRWIEERLQQETDLVLKLSKQLDPKLRNDLKRQSTKKTQARA